MPEAEIIARLQTRVPDFKLSPDPGGEWDWLLGLAALGVSTALIIGLSRKVLRRSSQAPLNQSDDPEVPEDEDLGDKLDDELLAMDC